MKPTLFFLCPTDHLETVIEQAFEQERYYCSSLGNSIIFDPQAMQELNRLIEAHQIQQIYFVLSEDNEIVLDAIDKDASKNTTELGSFYREISVKQESSNFSLEISDKYLTIISRFLRKRAQTLKTKLERSSLGHIRVDSLIYKPTEKSFSNIHSDLLELRQIQLN